MNVNTNSPSSRPAPMTCCGPTGGDPLTEAQSVELAGALKALADPVRVRLVSIVATSPNGEICACDLPDTLDRSQPTISHHLSILVDARVLEREQRGKWAWFRLHRERLAEIAGLLTSADRLTSSGPSC